MGHPQHDTPLVQPSNFLKEIGAASLSTPDSGFGYAQAGIARNTSEIQNFELGVSKIQSLL